MIRTDKDLNNFSSSEFFKSRRGRHRATGSPHGFFSEADAKKMEQHSHKIKTQKNAKISMIPVVKRPFRNLINALLKS